MDLIERQAAIDAFGLSEQTRKYGGDHSGYDTLMLYEIQMILEDLPSAQPEIIRCKDCKFYSPVNKETKTGICNLTMGAIHQIFGDDWFCAGAERKNDGSD